MDGSGSTHFPKRLNGDLRRVSVVSRDTAFGVVHSRNILWRLQEARFLSFFFFLLAITSHFALDSLSLPAVNTLAYPSLVCLSSLCSHATYILLANSDVLPAYSTTSCFAIMLSTVYSDMSIVAAGVLGLGFGTIVAVRRVKPNRLIVSLVLEALFAFISYVIFSHSSSLCVSDCLPYMFSGVLSVAYQMKDPSPREALAQRLLISKGAFVS
jgi:hypothetical protein